MKEGTVMSLLAAPALRAIEMYYLFRSYRIWGSRSGWGEITVERSSFFEHCSRALKLFFNTNIFQYSFERVEPLHFPAIF
jgi:hypothetical protein